MPVKICPECGASNHEKAGACVVCGASVERAKAVRPLGTGHDTDPEREEERVPEFDGNPRPSVASAGNGWLTAMVVIATVIYPFVGMIIGGVVAFGESKEKRDTGKFLLLLSLIIWLVRAVIIRLLIR